MGQEVDYIFKSWNQYQSYAFITLFVYQMRNDGLILTILSHPKHIFISVMNIKMRRIKHWISQDSEIQIQTRKPVNYQ